MGKKVSFMELSVRIERVKESIKTRIVEATQKDDDKTITLFTEMLRDIKTHVHDVGEKLTDIEKKVGITSEKKGKPGASKAAPAPAPVVANVVAAAPEVKEEPKGSSEAKPKKSKGKPADNKKKVPFARHLWSESDDIITLYLYKYDVAQLPYTLDEVIGKLGVTIGSFKMRRNNFKFLAGMGGLQNFSEQSKKIFDEYSPKSEEELRKIVLDLLK